MATITLKNLRKEFGAFIALEEVSLEIAEREFLVLLGPSGCGKTTTMRMVAGLERPTSGDVLIDGERVNDVHPRDRDLAMVFQSYGLYPHLTVRDNIAYPLKVRGIAKQQRYAEADKAAEKVELVDFMHRKPAELSGGQRQRVALARALIRKPRVFLMDEPLSNLDAQLRTMMRAHLKHLQRELATTTIYVTHDQVEAMTLADRVVVMNAGRVQQIGTPGEIYNRPENTFVAGFIGSPPMNLISGAIANEEFRHSSGSMGIKDAQDGAVVIGQRPEHLVLVAEGHGQLTGTVYAAEFLGDAVLVAVDLDGQLVNAKMPADCALTEGQTVDLKIDMAHLHLFATAGGYRLPVPEIR